MKNKKKHAGGRPTDYRDNYPDMLIEHLKKGFSFESFGGVVGASKETIYTWTEKHQEFLDAKKIGTSFSRLEWERKGIDGLYNETFKDDQGMTVSRSINATMWIFNMKNRFGWRDKNEEEESNKPSEINVNITKYVPPTD